MAAPQDLPVKSPFWARAISKYDGLGKYDISFVEGDLIHCLYKQGESLWVGILWRDSRVWGVFPFRLVEVLPEDFEPSIEEFPSDILKLIQNNFNTYSTIKNHLHDTATIDAHFRDYLSTWDKSLEFESRMSYKDIIASFRLHEQVEQDLNQINKHIVRLSSRWTSFYPKSYTRKETAGLNSALDNLEDRVLSASEMALKILRRADMNNWDVSIARPRLEEQNPKTLRGEDSMAEPLLNLVHQIQGEMDTMENDTVDLEECVVVEERTVSKSTNLKDLTSPDSFEPDDWRCAIEVHFKGVGSGISLNNFSNTTTFRRRQPVNAARSVPLDIEQQPAGVRVHTLSTSSSLNSKKTTKTIQLGGCVTIMTVFAAFIILSFFIGTYFNMNGHSMGDAYTLAGYILAIGTLPCGALCAYHYPRCKCWRKNSEKSEDNALELNELVGGVGS